MNPADRCPRCDLPRVPAGEWAQAFRAAADAGEQVTMRAFHDQWIASHPGMCTAPSADTCRRHPAVDWRALALALRPVVAAADEWRDCANLENQRRLTEAVDACRTRKP